MKKEIVNAKQFQGYNMSLMQLFGKGPKYTIVCGNCEYTFSKRISMVDYPTVECPRCNILNRLSLEIED